MAGYGLRPYRFASGGYSSGGYTEYPITDGETDDIFTGGFITQEATGYVTALGGDTGATPIDTNATTTTIGVAMGFRYIDPNGIPQWSQKYVGHASNTQAFAYVADDPHQQFVIQADGAGATTVQADVGLNFPVLLFANTDANTSTGLSGVVMDSSEGNTAVKALRLIGLVQDPTNLARSGTDTNNVIVEICPTVHQRNVVTGL